MRGTAGGDGDWSCEICESLEGHLYATRSRADSSIPLAGERLDRNGTHTHLPLLDSRTSADLLAQAMVYTLSLYLSESLAAMIEERNTRIQKAADEKTRIEEEVRPSLLSLPSR